MLSQNNQSVIPFSFEGASIRVVTGADGEPLFVAADACRILEIINVSQAVGRLDDDEKGICSIYTPGGAQQMQVVSEYGLLIQRQGKWI